MQARMHPDRSKRVRSRLALLGLLVGSTGCVRSVELPERIEGVTLTGQVVIRDTASGEWTGADGVSVQVRGSTRRVLTSDGGAFKIDRLPLDVTLSLELSAPPTEDGRERRRILDPVRGLVDGQAINLGVLQLGPTGGVAGRVLTLDDPLVEAAPGAGAIVVAAGTAFRAVSGADGRFSMSGLPEGAFELAAFLAGYRPARAEAVRVLPGSTSALEDIVLVPGETATVSVSSRVLRAALGDTEAGHAGLTVTFYRETNDPQPSVAGRASSGEDGRYQLEVAIGVYRVELGGPDLRALTLTGVAVLPEGVLGLPTVYLADAIAGDSDGDGVPDDQDEDDDNDGCRDEIDVFPTEPAFCFDADMDGIADSVDPDDDNDGLPDAEEITEGEDGWRTNPRNPDTDGDGVSDAADLCPTVADDQTDDNMNGVGDACEDIAPTNPNPRPRIDAISPLEGGAGTVVTIRGANLHLAEYPNLVQFGLPLETVAPVEPFEFASGILRVVVPPTARTGAVKVFAGGRTVTSTETFTFRESPFVVDLSPRAGRRGSRLTVIGQNLDGPDLRVFVNGQVADIIPHPTEGDVRPIFVGQTRYDAIDVIVPQTTSGRVVVEHRFGTGTSATDFVVTDAGVVITDLVPGTVPIGAVLRVQGHGFSTSDLVDPDPVTVIFNFEGTRIVQPILPGSVDSQILVEVPPGTMSGLVAVDHPTLDRPAVSPYPLVIDPLLPAPSGVSDRLIMVGDTLTITGNNLTGTSRVTFTGGATGTNVSSTSGTITVTVPPGVEPGPIEVTTPRGVASTPFGLSVLELSTNVVSNPSQAVTGGGFDAVGTEAYMLDRTNFFSVIATSTVTNEPSLVTRTNVSGRFQPSEFGTRFEVAPSGTVGVVFTNTNRALTVSLPSFAVRGACPLVDGNSSEAKTVFLGDEVAIDRKSSASATPTQIGVVRIDLSDGSCQEIDVGPTPSGGVAALLLGLGNGRVLLTKGGVGQATVDVDPASPTFGTLVEPWTPITGFVNAFSMVRGLNTQAFVLSTNHGVGYFEPQDANASLTIVEGNPLPTSHGRLDGVGRFLFTKTNTSIGQIIDTSDTPRLVRSAAPLDIQLGSGRTGHTGWLYTENVGRNFRLATIRAP